MTGFSDLAAIPRGHYGVIMADPPWRFKTYSAKAQRSADRHYSTMTLADIQALPVSDLAADDCALFLWGTSPHLQAVLPTIAAWGFEYKGKAFNWCKTNKLRAAGPANDPSTFFMGMGYGTRSNSEDCWLATRGRPKRLSGAVRELIVEPRREHSRKPDQAFDAARQLFAGPYLELFSREHREHWDTFGNQLNHFPAKLGLEE